MMKESMAWDFTDRKFCLWDWNLETGTVGLSYNWIELLGYEQDEFHPSSKWFNDLIHPEDKARVIYNLEGHLSGTESEETFSFRLKCKDDSFLLFESQGMIVLQDSSGKPGHMIWGSKLVGPEKTHYAEILWSIQ